MGTIVARRGRRVTKVAAGLAAAVLIASGGALVGATAANAYGNNLSSGAVQSVWAVSETNGTWFTSTSWTEVAHIDINNSNLYGVNKDVIRFSAESKCEGPAWGWCSVRILVDNYEAYPASGTDFSFDSVGSIYQARSMERYIEIGTGSHRITVQAAAVPYGGGAVPSFWLDDWTLSVWGLINQ